MKKILIAAVAALMALTSCMKDQVYSYPTLAGLNNTVATFDTDQVTVSVTVSAFVDITGVNLYYTIGTAAEKSVAMTKGAGGVYTGVIPAAPVGTEVKYYVEALTSGGSTKSAVATYKVGDVPVDYSGLKLNELNGNDKFIELYNAGSADIRILGVKIRKDASAEIWTAKDVTLAPGAFLLLYSEDVVVAGGAQEGYNEDLVFHSGLSAKKGVRIELLDPKDNPIDDFNLVTLLKSKAPASYGRNADGKWYYQDATPGAANTDGTDVVFAE